MKRSLFIINTILFFLIFSVKFYAAYDNNLETNNIPLNYYSSLDMNLTGAEFRQDLSEIISANYVQYPYSSNGIDVHEILKESDADPSGNGNVICIYTGLSMQPEQTGTYNWDKEHVWAKSHGFPEDSYDDSEAFSDAHNLRPCLSTVNRSRSDKDFGEVANPTRNDYGSIQDSYTFEPRDEVKGDVARIMFYMATRYGFDEFNLTLVDDTDTSGSSLNGRFGNLNTLIKWHYNDPVSTSEIYRNNVVYKYQKNRNPYIDHPEYVDYAYPNEHSGLDKDVEKINQVILAIDNLPNTITLNDKTAVIATMELFNQLNAMEKQDVTNYNKLSTAINTINILENGNIPSQELKEELTYSHTFDANYFTGSGESKDLSGINWKLELQGEGTVSTYSSTKGLHLGTNSTPCTQVKLISETSFNNISKIVVNASGNSDVNADMIVQIGTKTSGDFSLTETPTDYEYEIDDLSGQVSIIINVNTKKAVFIKSIKIYTIVIPDITETFVNEQTKASLNIEYNPITLEPIDVDLRFGSMISYNSYNSNANYGVIVLSSSQASRLTNLTSVTELKNEGYAVEIEPVLVTGGYQFAWVINNIEKNNYDFEFVAVIYMEYEGVLYLGQAKTHSVNSVAQSYIQQNLITDDTIKTIIINIYE